MYILKNIFLAESAFKRTEIVSSSFDDQGVVNINIESINGESKEFNIALNVELFQPDEENPEVEIKLKMVGLFETEGENDQLSQDTFSHINAPAMIYPFVREHIASLTVKAGIGSIFLPPFNFVAMNQVRLKQQAEQQEEESPIS